MNYIDEELFNKISKNYIDPDNEEQVKELNNLKQDLDHYITTLDLARQRTCLNTSISQKERLLKLNGINRTVLNTFVQNLELRFRNNPYYNPNTIQQHEKEKEIQSKKDTETTIQ